MQTRSMRLVFGAAVALAISVTGNAVYAHHSFAMFDMQKTLTVEGTVKDYQWNNPHIWIDIIVDDAASKQPVLWSVEAGSVAIQTRMGWTRTSLKPGDKASLVVHPLKSAAIGGSLVSGSVNGTPIGHPIDWNSQ